jgi:restriction system protein
LSLALSWQASPDLDEHVDLVALLLSDAGRVRSDADLVFYNAPSAEGGSIRLLGRQSSGGRSAEALDVDLTRMSPGVGSIVVAATMSSGSFNGLVDLDLLISAADCSTPALRVDLTGAGTERAYVAVELYRRNGEWKIRAVGQGWNSGLAGLATEYGLDIEPEGVPVPAQSSAAAANGPPAKHAPDYSNIVEWFGRTAEDRRVLHLEPHEAATRRLGVLSQSCRRLAVDPAGRRAYKEARQNELAAYSELAMARTEQLTSILLSSMQRTGRIRERLTQRPQLPPFDPGSLAHTEEGPQISAYLPPQPTGLNKVFGRDRHSQAVAEAEQRFAEASTQHAARQQARQQRLAAARAAHERATSELLTSYERRCADVDMLWRSLEAHEAAAVRAYHEMVLLALSVDPVFPTDFPRSFRVAYTPESRQLAVEYDLPASTAIPPEKSYKYTVGTDIIGPVSRSAAEAKKLYADVIANTSLAILYTLFTEDSYRTFDTLVFNGMVDAIDPATGINIRPCLVTVRATREVFEQLSLGNVDPAACLRHLGASVSKSPAELLPVRPVLEFSMVDPRFVSSTDVLGDLDNRANLMELSPSEFENLITNLFARMGLETRLTQASRDGGVDCVAFDPRPIFGGKVVIQAKRYKNTVGVSAVRDLYGTMQNEGASKGILVTTSGYGQASYQFASNKPLELIDGANLLYLLAEHAGIEARIVPPEDWNDPKADASSAT